MWRKVTFGATALCLAWSAYEVLFEEHEVDEYKAVPYRAINIKPLPWADGKTRTSSLHMCRGAAALILSVTALFAHLGGWTPEKDLELAAEHGHHKH